MVVVWWSAAGLIHYSFLNPTEITTSEKYAMPAAGGIGQQKGANSLGRHLTTYLTTNASKVKQIGLQSFASSTTFT